MSEFNAGEYTLPLGKKTYVMGILNLTPDSFSDGGEYFDGEKALSRALEIQAEGADILDIGAQSTRPGAEPLTPESELDRLERILKKIIQKVHIPVSIDTFFPQVAEYALECGASIVNDVSGKINKSMSKAVKKHGAGLVIMHNGGGADSLPKYERPIAEEVRSFFLEELQAAQKYSIDKNRLCLDPGIGFGKNRDEDLILIAKTAKIKVEGVPFLFGVSRKRVLGNLNSRHEKDLATLAANTAAILGGANIIRVHNVAMARTGADFADRLRKQ